MDITIKRLAEAITASELSYVELERRTNIAKSSLQRYATGKTKKIPIDAIQVIAKATGTSAAWIMGWTDESTQKKNDGIADIILDLRKDSLLLELVQDLRALTVEQRQAVRTFLSAFKQKNVD